MNKQDKKRMCSGCRNNRYNMGKGFVEREGIDAVVTVDECWSLKDAKVVLNKRVSISQTPPFTQSPIKVLSCYSESGYVYIDKNRME